MNSNQTRREFLRTASAATLAAASLPSALAQADKQITVAFVGVAHIHTPSYMDLLRKRKDVKIKCFWEHDPARAEGAPRPPASRWPRTRRRYGPIRRSPP